MAPEPEQYIQIENNDRATVKKVTIKRPSKKLQQEESLIEPEAKLSLLMPFNDTIQEEIQNSLGTLYQNDFTVIGQINSLKKEFLNERQKMDLDFQGSYAIFNKIVQWACIINYAVNTVSQKVDFFKKASSISVQVDEKINLIQSSSNQAITDL